MVDILIALDKYSDWLETYSIANACVVPPRLVSIHIVDNDRNDKDSIYSVYQSMFYKAGAFEVIVHADKTSFFQTVSIEAAKLEPNDIFAAPFVRYRDLWKLTSNCNKGVQTVHLSECLPDTFGHVGYRLGFKGNNIKTWASLPLAKIYAVTHKPELCYFPLSPAVSNPFVKRTEQVAIPQLLESKSQLIRNLFKNEMRPLLIGGFGYDVEKMASFLGVDKFVSTTKGKVLIVDGKDVELSERICAEEVILSGLASTVVGYNSSAMLWAKKIVPHIKIQCYEASLLSKIYGSMYNVYAKRALKKVGIELMPENTNMQLS